MEVALLYYAPLWGLFGYRRATSCGWPARGVDGILQPVAQLVAGDMQQSSRLHLVSLAARQGFVNKFALDLAQKSAQVNAFGRQAQLLLHFIQATGGIAAPLPDLFRQVFGENHVVIAEDMTALNDGA